MNTHSSLQVGPHTIRFLADDSFSLALNGVIEPQDVRAMVDVERACAEKNGYVLIIVDATAVTGLPVETRRAASKMVSELNDIHGVCVIYGTSLTTRVLMGMLFNAVRILSRQEPKFHTSFVATREDALRDIEAARTKFHARSR
jgi:hypothetical protein